jgi:hypothetical protein
MSQLDILVNTRGPPGEQKVVFCRRNVLPLFSMNNRFRQDQPLLVILLANSKSSMNTVKLFPCMYLYIRSFLKPDSSLWSNIHSIVRKVMVFICLVIDIQMTSSRVLRIVWANFYSCYVLGNLCENSCKRFCFKCLGSLSILSWLMSEDFIFEKLEKESLSFKV